MQPGTELRPQGNSLTKDKLALATEDLLNVLVGETLVDCRDVDTLKDALQIAQWVDQ